MTKHSGDGSKGKRERWREPVDRYSSVSDATDAATAFLRAADRLITRGKPPQELTEAEALGIRIAAQLQILFQGGDPDHALPALRSANAALCGPENREERRYLACRAIADWATKWQQQEWQASIQSRFLLLRQLRDDLAFLDPAFNDIWLPSLVGRLNVFTPKRANGKKTPERILADIIVEDCDALGIEVPPDKDHEKAVDDVRKLLTNDISDFLGSKKTAKKQP